MSAAGRIEAYMTVPSGALLSATNDTYTAEAVSLTADDYTPTEFCAHLAARLNAVAPPSTGSWTVTLSTGTSGTGLVTINCTGTWALTFTTAEAGTVIGFVGNIASRSSAATGTQNARGLWLPKKHLVMMSDPARAPEVSDARSNEGPRGTVRTYVSSFKYRHQKLVWKNVSQARTWEGETDSGARPTCGSWQQWVRDTQWGRGHTWFGVGSAFQVYWDNAGSDSIVGYDLNGGAGPTNGWKFSPAIAKIEDTARMASSSGWLGLWNIETPAIVAGD